MWLKAGQVAGGDGMLAGGGEVDGVWLMSEEGVVAAI
eukprot:COSAG06_NODE_49497_length_325_cov_0.632743_2_plen_36_part_01